MSPPIFGSGHGPELGFSNPNVQRLRRLLGRRSARSDEGVFVVEGAMLIGEAVRAGWEIEAQFVAPDVVPISAGGSVHRLAPGVAERVSDLESAPGSFAVVVAHHHDPQHVAATLSDAEFVVLADRLRDPGNLGTVMRSAEAAGADAVVVTPETVDPTSPKVLRASAGAAFHVPIVAADLGEVRGSGLRLLGTSSHHGTPHDHVDWTGRIALVLGNEAAGLDADAPVDEWVRIAHHGRAESLNVAMAATVLCFEAARQRAR